MPSDSQFWVILVAWLYQNNIHPSEFQQKHKVIWHFIAYLSPTSCFNKTHIFTFSFLSSLVAKIGLMFRFWPIRLQWSPLERSSSYSRKGFFFFSFPAVPTHPIFEYGHDAEGNSSPLVSSMKKWVSLPRMVNRKIGRVWSLMTPEAADPFLQNSAYVKKVTPICSSHSESNFPIFTAKTFVTQTNWCLAWWANFPLKEEFWPMWANIPFKQHGCIQVKVQEAGNLTVNFAHSWCLLMFVLSPWGPPGPQ